ncbi:MAG: antibiotic biosynthesis monooxygenase [Micropruina sp.]|uniref:antibiotic biosynthesis monooxygenase n=1 Tax=Micropruina sp. TaxID=2737536 RepID=UPI0039E52D0E
MITTVCNVHVIDDGVEAFKQASLANVAGSRQEAGVTRFDLLQQVDDPTRFIIYEEYVDQAATLAHKETAHYLAWRDAVAELMASPRNTYSFGDKL